MALAAVNTHVYKDALPYTDWNIAAADLNYLVVAGGDLASASTIITTNEFHKITGTTTIQTISPASPVLGQQIRLWIKDGPVTFKSSVGNIRTNSGNDYVAAANEIVVLNYETVGSFWRLVGRDTIDKQTNNGQQINGSFTTAGRLIQGAFVGTSSGSTITPNMSNGSVQYFDYTGTAAMTVANPTNVIATNSLAETFHLIIRNQRGDNITSISWGTLYKGGTLPTAPTFANNAYINFSFLWLGRGGWMVLIGGSGITTSANGWT